MILKYKKPKLLLGLMGQKALSILVSNRLLLGKSNRNADALSQFSQKSMDEKTALQAENIQILHNLQFSLTKTSLSGLKLSNSGLLPHHQIFICRIHIFLQLY